MAKNDLDRFITAQAPVFDRAVQELTRGQKRSHWMWFIFPQLEGLGHSPMAQHYAISGLDEARHYLEHPVLGERLRTCCRLMLSHEHRTAHEILGSPDDLKFRSSLTLFQKAAGNSQDRDLFAKGLSVFYGGKPDARTIELLG
jgi:uncharacterized protein (DUF1810 family)